MTKLISNNEKIKVAITGSKGFIGTHLIDKLKSMNTEFIEIDIKDGYDITDKKTLERLPHFDVLCHLAARVFVPNSYKYPYDFYNTNVLGTLNMLEICRNFKAKMVFMSTYVYGIPHYLPIDELHPISPFNPYTNTKIIGEQLCKGYYNDFNLSTIILRPFNTYGIGQNVDFLIPSIINQVQNGKILLKDPKPKRDMLFITDLVDAIVNCILYKDTPFEIFNIGSGESFSVFEIAHLVREICQNKVVIEFSGETRPSEVIDTIADIRKANYFLGWKPQISMEEGLKILLTKQINN